MKHISIVWFRQDLRLQDNLAWQAAIQAGRPILPIYILDDTEPDRAIGGASVAWLAQSLKALNHSLDGHLRLYHGKVEEILPNLIERHQVCGLYWNRCYEPWRIRVDTAIKTLYKGQLDCHSFNSSLLWEPWEVQKTDGTPYQVFTPFYQKGCLTAKAPPAPIQTSPDFTLYRADDGASPEGLDIAPKAPWAEKILSTWQPGETGAQSRWNSFSQQHLQGYKQGRNFPHQKHVSRLSPHIHFGEISVRQLWHEVQTLKSLGHIVHADAEHFLSELAWREFSHHLLFYFPELPSKNFRPKFDTFPWRNNPQYWQAWSKGQTGYPIVDAGMRELWQTGYMHNRVRMIVGSFLVKNLRLDWRQGAQWFWDCLFDADLANNSASWQWVAGCGADAAPYFRIFNPVLQANKFDPSGDYIKTFVPELQKLAPPHLFAPWEAPHSVLSAAGIVLGQDYPQPIIDFTTSRHEALEALSQTKAD